MHSLLQTLAANIYNEKLSDLEFRDFFLSNISNIKLMGDAEFRAHFAPLFVKHKDLFSAFITPVSLEADKEFRGKLIDSLRNSETLDDGQFREAIERLMLGCDDLAKVAKRFKK